MNVNTTSTDAARACLADHFLGILSREGASLEEAEDLCIELGHSLMAAALAAALERLDARLCAGLAGGVRVRGMKRRTLATKMGDVTFRCRCCRDASGNAVSPLEEALDVPWGARVPRGRLLPRRGGRRGLVCAARRGCSRGRAARASPPSP